MNCRQALAYRIVMVFAIMFMPSLLHGQRTFTMYKGVVAGTMKITMHLNVERSLLNIPGRKVRMLRYSGYYSHDSIGERIPLFGLEFDELQYSHPGNPFRIVLRSEHAGRWSRAFLGGISSEGSFIGAWYDPDSSRGYLAILYECDPYDTAAAAIAWSREFRELSDFWSRWQDAVKNFQKEKVADMTDFPLMGSDILVSRWESIRLFEESMMHIVATAEQMDRAAFLEPYTYRRIFDSDARKKFLKTSPADLYALPSGPAQRGAVPFGTPIYYASITYDEGQDEENTFAFGFAKIDGVYKLVVVIEMG